MMQPILESLAIHLLSRDDSRLGNTRIILPNRRAGLFLQRHLARHNSQVQWSPAISSISDFISEISCYDPVDSLEALFILYDVYRVSVNEPETLDDFYYLGEMMLRDFDEIDKYLVDAGMLFSNIIDLKALEEPLAGLEPEQMAFIRQFWSGFYTGDQTPEKEQFFRIWKLLPLLYNGLRKALDARGTGYPGMQYREVVGRIARGEMDHLREESVIVAGFNALNSCEKKIFSWLQQQGAGFFWDYDPHSMEDPESEAGRFLRENMRMFPQETVLSHGRSAKGKYPIRVFELPTDVLQAKTVHRILKEDTATRDDCTDTAVILCDEALLMPVITSLPGDREEINITMGYPMKNTPVSGLIDALFRLQKNLRKGSGGRILFYHKDVISILLHPYLSDGNDAGGQDGTVNPLTDEIISNNLVLVDQHYFRGALQQKIFRSLKDAADLLDYLRDIFNHILELLAGKEGGIYQMLDREFIFRLLLRLNQLGILMNRWPGMTFSMLERLIKKMLSGLNVPFEGEPLSGLQVMGILETRLLDFRHLILLSMNEEVMPASHTAQSNIPYSLRLAFKMPSREDMEAIYAYYFYRLIQRAEKIDLLYNSGSEGVRTGEMSRYLYQLIFRQNLKVIQPVLEVVARERHPIVIHHTPETRGKLAGYLLPGKEERYLSPSAINTYIDCPLKFYFRYLAGIGEPDEVQEEIDAAGLGTVVHDSIRELYSEIAGHSGGTITPQDLQNLLGSGETGQVLRRVFQEHHFRGRKQQTIEGRNIILVHVMLRYLEKIINTDMALAPFTLVAAEQSYRRSLEITVGNKRLKAKLGGKIDRIDRVGDTLRVIDYKTGNARQGFSEIADLFDPGVHNRNGAAMQTLFYAWLVVEDHREEKILPGLYVMRELFGSHFDPSLTMGKQRNRRQVSSFREVEGEFVTHLSHTISRMFDDTIPFQQRKHDDKCNSCGYAAICNRRSVD